MRNSTVRLAADSFSLSNSRFVNGVVNSRSSVWRSRSDANVRHVTPITISRHRYEKTDINNDTDFVTGMNAVAACINQPCPFEQHHSAEKRDVQLPAGKCGNLSFTPGDGLYVSETHERLGSLPSEDYDPRAMFSKRFGKSFARETRPLETRVMLLAGRTSQTPES